ncbi:hypothetical protein ES702_05554 [subsurface metagenome]
MLERLLERGSVDEDDMWDDEQPLSSSSEKFVSVLKYGWGSHGYYRIVGSGEVTNQFCARKVGFNGCVNVGKHNYVGLDGVYYRGKVHVDLVFNFCKKPSCPICYKKGFSVREAGNIEARLTENGKFKNCFGRFGLIEHIVCSIPVKDYNMSHKALRRKANRILQSLGVVGHCLIFHAFRYNDFRGWYFSPHWHALGFIVDGFSKCRNCKRLHERNCLAGCGRFYDRAWQNYKKTGYYTKVMGRRRTIFGTAVYQLGHSSYKVGVERFHVVTWAGCVSYRKLKVTKEIRKKFCPMCKEELVRLTYSGNLFFVTDMNSPDYRRSFLADFEEDGVPVWSVKVKGSAVARGCRIVDADYLSFSRESILEFEADFEAQEKWADRREKVAEVWHGSLPKKQL